ncbi:MAG: hypothetical protein E6G56_11145 [Actinobacteria bacterium]|nr:MAG: hypothetical protein E6G56_11145 [Actinomycetota bacterium]
MDQAPIIVAYDGSPHAEDALALAAALADAGASRLAVAHVYRAPRSGVRTGAASRRGRERFMRATAHDLLGRVSPGAGRQPRPLVIGSTTTARGISTLAQREGAALVVWGSASDAPPGHVRPGSAARRLLQGGPCAQAFAPAGFRERDRHRPTTVTLGEHDADADARSSVHGLAEALGASVAAGARGEDTLLVLGSRPDAEEGRVLASAGTDRAIRTAGGPVVVLSRGHGLGLGGRPAAVAA